MWINSWLFEFDLENIELNWLNKNILISPSQISVLNFCGFR